MTDPIHPTLTDAEVNNDPLAPSVRRIDSSRWTCVMDRKHLEPAP